MKKDSISVVPKNQRDVVKAQTKDVWDGEVKWPALHGKSFRDLKVLDSDSLVAVDQHGAIILAARSQQQQQQQQQQQRDGDDALVHVLSNANVSQLAVTRDSIVALTKAGLLLSIDKSVVTSSLNERLRVVKKSEHQSATSWASWFWRPQFSGIAVDLGLVESLTFFNGVSERITSITAGDHHVLALSASGKVYSMSTSNNSETTNKYCQLGLGESAFTSSITRNKLYHVSGLASLPPSTLSTSTRSSPAKIIQIASGSAFNLALASDGSVYSWGSNRYGQLGTANKGKDIAYSADPIKVSFDATNQYKNSQCTLIAAGGDTGCFVFESPESTLVYSVGMGQWGQLGTGTFLHVSNKPIKVSVLSNLSEFNEKLNKVVPIRIASVSMGPTHAFAILKSSETVEGYGRDVFSWGANDKGQLWRADGKKGNSAVPGSVAPVVVAVGDVSAATEEEGGQKADESVSTLTNFLWEPKNVGRLQVAGPGKLTTTSSSASWFCGNNAGTVEQQFACGDGVTLLYSKTV
ncbi:UNVERIFIED_CONTAM: hypothetical protein HDU68_008251 [Siphonaria sp. JEL0065]|nr:hypothetical protein HDU68_008251 [Siphonaria sp. JEL0065]